MPVTGGVLAYPGVVPGFLVPGAPPQASPLASIALPGYATLVARPPALANKYFPGDEVELVAGFRTLQLQAATPTSVTFYVQPPSGGVQTPTVSNPETGVYTTAISIPAGTAGVGTWRYRVESTGNPTRALEGSFVVQPTSFAA